MLKVRVCAVTCQSPYDDEDAQFEQSLLTYVKKEELSTMRRDTRSLYRYPLDSSRTTLHTQTRLLDQLSCCLLCNYSTHVSCRHRQHSTASMFTDNTASLPKVIWEKGRVVKSPLVTMARPKFAPKSTPSRGPIAKPHHLPHPWTRPTYDAKRHPDLICRFKQCTGQTDRPTHVRTDRQIDHGKG